MPERGEQREFVLKEIARQTAKALHTKLEQKQRTMQSISKLQHRGCKHVPLAPHELFSTQTSFGARFGSHIFALMTYWKKCRNSMPPYMPLFEVDLRGQHWLLQKEWS